MLRDLPLPELKESGRVVVEDVALLFAGQDGASSMIAMAGSMTPGHII